MKTKASLKLVFFPCDYWPTMGGVSVSVYNLASRLGKRGMGVSVISKNPAGLYPEREIIEGVNIERIRRITFPKLWSYLSKARPEILNVFYLESTSIYLWLLKLIFKFKLVVSFRGTDISYLINNKLKPYSLIWRRLILAFTDAIIFNSEYLHKEALTLFRKQLENKSFVILNGVDTNLFNLTPYKHKRPYILSITHFVQAKPPGILLESFALIHDQYPEIDLIIVADKKDPLYYQAEAICQKTNMQNNVIFWGKADRHDILQLLNGCLFFLHLPLQEAFGIVLLEAMAARKAIVASRVGGIPEIIKDNFNGLLVPADVPDEIAAAVLKLLDDADLRERLGGNGYNFIKDRYTWEKAADQYFQLYSNLVGTK